MNSKLNPILTLEYMCKEKENQFTVKRIQVYQMYETEEQMERREEKETQHEEQKEK